MWFEIWKGRNKFAKRRIRTRVYDTRFTICAAGADDWWWSFVILKSNHMLVSGVSVNSLCQQGGLFALSVNRHSVFINIKLALCSKTVLESFENCHIYVKKKPDAGFMFYADIRGFCDEKSQHIYNLNIFAEVAFHGNHFSHDHIQRLPWYWGLVLIFRHTSLHTWSQHVIAKEKGPPSAQEFMLTTAPEQGQN